MEEHATERDQTTATRAASNKGRSSATRRPSGKDIQEVEWQFDAAGLEEVEGWLKEYDSGSGLSVAPGSTRELTDTYLDTEDWRLHRAGYALRVRRKGSNKTAEATMKSLAFTGDSSEGNVRRREISERVRSGGIGFFSGLSESRGPVGERLRALAGSHEVRPLFEVRTRRQTFNLILEEQEDIGADVSSGEIVQDTSGNIPRGSDGTHIGEVALDATKILLGNGEEPARLSRVEVEVIEAEPPAAVSRFVRVMRRSLGLEQTTVSKYETGLSAADLSPDGGRNPVRRR